MSPRIEIAGAAWHLMTRTPTGVPLFRDDEDARLYLVLIAEEARERGWVILTYCLMPNHVHFVLITPQPDLGAGLKRVHERYVGYLHRKHGTNGHVIGGRFKNKLVDTDAYVVALLRYVGRNPVPSMCKAPEQWDWSAHRALAGLSPVPSFLAAERALSFLHEDPVLARATYTALVGQSDEALLSALATGGPDDDWLVAAVDHHCIPIPTIGRFLGLGRTKVYDRLAEARTKRSDL